MFGTWASFSNRLCPDRTRENIWVWWSRLPFQLLGRLRQEDHKLRASLSYTLGSEIP